MNADVLTEPDIERLPERNERTQDALLELKNTISRMIGEGKLPNDGETLQWVRGIDAELERESADRRTLLTRRTPLTNRKKEETI